MNISLSVYNTGTYLNRRSGKNHAASNVEPIQRLESEGFCTIEIMNIASICGRIATFQNFSGVGLRRRAAIRLCNSEDKKKVCARFRTTRSLLCKNTLNILSQKSPTALTWVCNITSACCNPSAHLLKCFTFSAFSVNYQCW